MAVNITNFTTNVNNISALSDKPNETDGLTSGELKARFDKAGGDIKEYLNGVLIPEIETAFNTTMPTDFVLNSDSRLSDSRPCNGTFDSWSTARSNLKISYGTSLPSGGEDGSIFFLYS